MKNRLKDVQKAKSHSVRQFCELIGCQQPTILKQLAGERAVSIDTIVAVIKTFSDISPDWMLLGVGEMYRKPEGSINISKVTTGDMSPVGVGNTVSADAGELARLQEENRVLRERCDKLTDKLLNTL